MPTPKPTDQPDLGQEDRLRAAVGQVALEVSQELDWDRAVQAILRAAETALGADAVVLWTADPEARLLRRAAWDGIPEADLRQVQEVSFDASLLIAKAARVGRIQVVENCPPSSRGRHLLALVPPGL